MKSPILEGLVCGFGLLALAAVGFFMSHSNPGFWALLALVGIAALFSSFYLRFRG